MASANSFTQDHTCPAQGECRICELTRTRFEALQRKYGSHELARRIAKLKSYRAFAQRWPYDGSERPVSLDIEIAGDHGTIALVDLLPSGSVHQEPAQIDSEAVAAFKKILSPRQLQVTELLEQGYKPKEIYLLLGYRNTGGVRYLKWAIRRKYEAFREDWNI